MEAAEAGLFIHGDPRLASLQDFLACVLEKSPPPARWATDAQKKYTRRATEKERFGATVLKNPTHVKIHLSNRDIPGISA